MNAKLSGLGAEPKKLVLLGLCLAIAGYFYFSSSNSGDSSSAAGVTKPGAQQGAETAAPLAQRVSRGRGKQRLGAGNSLDAFHPSLKMDKDLDRASIDPTLRLDLLERLRNVKAEAGTRSLFEAGAVQVAASNIPEPKTIAVVKKAFIGPQPPPPPAKPVETPAPPIPLKFYGFIAPRQVTVGPKRAFFLDGDDIIVGAEGQLIKNRYRVVRIGVNSAVVEDTQFKNHQQTLPLIEEQQG